MRFGDFLVGWLVGAVVGFFLGMIPGHIAHTDCQAALLESCKRDGGNQLDGFKCVRVEGVK